MANCRDKKITPKGKYRLPKDKASNKNKEKPILEGGWQPLQDKTDPTHSPPLILLHYLPA
jgi:hypothetical protein